MGTAGEGELKQLLLGKGVSLSSQFRLTYSMILNMLRVEDLKVRGMVFISYLRSIIFPADTMMSYGQHVMIRRRSAWQLLLTPGSLKYTLVFMHDLAG